MSIKNKIRDYIYSFCDRNWDGHIDVGISENDNHYPTLMKGKVMYIPFLYNDKKTKLEVRVYEFSHLY